MPGPSPRSTVAKSVGPMSEVTGHAVDNALYIVVTCSSAHVLRLLSNATVPSTLINKGNSGVPSARLPVIELEFVPNGFSVGVITANEFVPLFTHGH